jgi:transposase
MLLGNCAKSSSERLLAYSICACREDDRSSPSEQEEAQDPRCRPLRRYKRRWKIERLFAWLGAFRRLVVRYERYALNYLGFVQLGCILILLRWY